jgi:hypothetical protein
MQVIYQPAVGAAVLIQGLFDELYSLAQAGAEAGTETLVPAVFLRLSDLPVDPEQDDPTLTIAGFDYRVIERRTAGLGAIVLALRKVV